MLDQADGQAKILVITGDGSFCNRTVFGTIPERTVLLMRARKDSRLCFPAPAGGRRTYGESKFTPEDIRTDVSLPWRQTKNFYGGKRRLIRYKEVKGVLWQNGARTLPLRLLVVAPTGYYKRKNGRKYYRQPAFLLTTDLTSSARQLLQIYFDRWQIEVNHREEKDTLGVGEAQLWNPISVPKQPALVVASYSALHLCALRRFGAERTVAYAQLPKWRRHAKRPSCQDLITLLRKDAVEQAKLLHHLGLSYQSDHLVAAAAA